MFLKSVDAFYYVAQTLLISLFQRRDTTLKQTPSGRAKNHIHSVHLDFKIAWFRNFPSLLCGTLWYFLTYFRIATYILLQILNKQHLLNTYILEAILFHSCSLVQTELVMLTGKKGVSRLLSRQQRLPMLFRIRIAKKPTSTTRFVSTLQNKFVKCRSRNRLFHKIS